MRIEQKYFIPFMLGVALICVLAIAFFNLRSLGGQQERFVNAVGDGDDLYSHNFFEFTSADSIRIRDFDQNYTAALFFSSWSNRAMNAFHQLNELTGEYENLNIFAMAVKDDQSYLVSIIEESSDRIRLVDGTRFYSDFKIPGLPSVVLFDHAGSIVGLRMGYSSSGDYDFIRVVLDE